MARSVDEAFPHLTESVMTHGWIKIGYDVNASVLSILCR